jgi:mRNA interferase MazF
MLIFTVENSKIMSNYMPERFDIIFLDFEPKKGNEIGKYRPALVLSSKAYNQKTGLLICCPISTSIRGHLTEVPIDYLERPSVIVSGIVQTLSWKARKAKFVKKASHETFEAVLQRLLPLMGAEEFLNAQ